jgi:hypothetical protein
MRNRRGNTGRHRHTKARSLRDRHGESARTRCAVREERRKSLFSPFHLSASHHIQNLAAQAAPGCAGRRWQGPDNHVGAGFKRIHQLIAGRFQPPPNQISCHRVTHRFGNDEAKANRRGVVPVEQVRHGVVCSHFSAAAHRVPIVVCMNHPIDSGKHGNYLTEAVRSGCKLRGELSAALATTSTEDGATCTGAHTQTKTVHLGAAAIVRLKSSLAHRYSSPRVGIPQGQQ